MMNRTTYHDIHTNRQIGNIWELSISASPSINEYLDGSATVNRGKMYSDTGQHSTFHAGDYEPLE